MPTPLTPMNALALTAQMKTLSKAVGAFEKLGKKEKGTEVSAFSSKWMGPANAPIELANRAKKMRKDGGSIRAVSKAIGCPMGSLTALLNRAD